MMIVIIIGLWWRVFSHTDCCSFIAELDHLFRITFLWMAFVMHDFLTASVPNAGYSYCAM